MTTASLFREENVSWTVREEGKQDETNVEQTPAGS